MNANTIQPTQGPSAPAMGPVPSLVPLSMLALCLVSLAYLVLCPYTKVEESFGMQATHDLYYFGCRPAIRHFLVQQLQMEGALDGFESFSEKEDLPYDHLHYPGVVPRTFLGAAVMAAGAKIITGMLSVVTSGNFDMEHRPQVLQLLSRGVLMVFNLYALHQLAMALPGAFRNNTRHLSAFFLLITASQFHIPFYISRTLPNTFALGLCTLAYREWIGPSPSDDNYAREGVKPAKPYKACWILVFTFLVFRCDVILLWGCIGLTMWLVQKQLSVVGSILTALSAAVTAFTVTIPLDSLLWKSPLSNNGQDSFWHWIVWSEGKVLLFNTMENKSSEWGTQVWHWYFSRALPRVMLATAILVPFSFLRITEYIQLWYQAIVLGRRSSISATDNTTLRSTPKVYRHFTAVAYPPLVDTTFLPYLAAVLGFVMLYSCLPHKEVRFLFPILPMLNVAAALGLDRLYQLATSGDLPSPYASFNRKQSEASPAAQHKKTDGDQTVKVNSDNDNDNKNNVKTEGKLRNVSRHKILRDRHDRGSVAVRLFRSIPFWCGLACLLVTFCGSVVFLMMSRHNYPGGVALDLLRQHFDAQSKLHMEVSENPLAAAMKLDVNSLSPTNSHRRPVVRKVYVSQRACVDLAAAMTGVTLFGQDAAMNAFEASAGTASSPSLLFVKEGYEVENQMKDGDSTNSNDEAATTPQALGRKWGHCDYLLTEHGTVEGFDVLNVAQGHPQFSWNRKNIDTHDAMYVMVNKHAEQVYLADGGDADEASE
jgi:alpha-1,6-mannosyltransferase